jgi:hypothetical protein
MRSEMTTKDPKDMNDQELAGFHEEHRGDVSLWEKKPRQIRKRRGGPSTVFTLRLAPEELEQLYRAGADRGETLSDFIRKGALARAAELGDSRKRAKARA